MKPKRKCYCFRAARELLEGNDSLDEIIIPPHNEGVFIGFCWLVIPVGIDEETNGRVPQLARIQDQFRIIVGDLGACFCRVHFVFILTLFPNDLDGIADF